MSTRVGDSERYRKSEEFLSRALKVIPGGSQTLTKSVHQFPLGVSPLFAVSARGSRIRDLDGNEYIDFVNSLAAVNLGHGDIDVETAVRKQIESGVLFSLPHIIETEVAEMLSELVPCAEMTRFGKNGSDVTSAAIRLARAYTRRDHVLVCGYHGWQDWYISSTSQNRGVPRAVAELTHSVPYNDIDAVHRMLGKYKGDVAAMILEPMNIIWPRSGYLEELQAMMRREGSLLIFDEMVTGFRFSSGGAQKLFEVTPDLATFGKGMANGYPVSALCGRAEVMRTMTDVFVSLTYGGEAVSLAAALATMRKIANEPVIEVIRSQGSKLECGVRKLIDEHGIAHILSICGHPAWTFLLFSDVGDYTQWQIKTLFLQEVFLRGILTIGLHIVSYAHSDEDIDRLLKVYAEVFPLLKDAVDNRKLDSLLRTRPLEPQFKLRS